MDRIGIALVTGLAVSFVCLGAAAMALAALLAATGMKEETLGVATYVIHALSALAGGVTSARKTGVRGWYCGGCAGLAYTAAVLLVGFLAFDVPWTKHAVWTAFVAAPSGMLGGMIGVGLGK